VGHDDALLSEGLHHGCQERDSPNAHGGKATAGQDKLEKLIRDIKTEQSKMAQKEGDIVSNLFRIGALINELQNAAGRTWTKQVQKLGYHPRAASRLQKIASSWQGEIGTLGSEILPRLPNDVQKLEWLCRLRREQLETLLARLDLKKVCRKEVTAAVKELLGESTTTQTTGGGIVKVINQLFARVMKAIEGWQQTGDDQETPEQLRGVLSGGLEQLQQALDNLPAGTESEAAHV
jgi:hypothetical protein